MEADVCSGAQCIAAECRYIDLPGGDTLVLSTLGGAMTKDSADYSPNMASQPVSIDELFRNVPVQSAEDLACAGVFDTDEELEEFLKHIHAARRADLA